MLKIQKNSIKRRFPFLRDFRTIYAFDATDAEFPEPIGYFADDREKYEFVKKKILLQDIALHLGNTFGEYHVHKINTEGALPAIEGKSWQSITEKSIARQWPTMWKQSEMKTNMLSQRHLFFLL